MNAAHSRACGCVTLLMREEGREEKDMDWHMLSLLWVCAWTSRGGGSVAGWAAGAYMLGLLHCQVKKISGIYYI